MTRSEFINDLRSRVWNLPVEEVSAAVRYYDNFISEAGVENEQAILAKLGSPQRVADNVIREYNTALSPQGKHDYSNTNHVKDYNFDNTQNNSYQNNGYNNTNQNTGYNYSNQNQNNGYQNNGYQNNGYQQKRLFKSEKDRMISGVCGGLAEYFNIDPSLVRILTVFAAFTGAGFIAYLVAAVILPDKSRL